MAQEQGAHTASNSRLILSLSNPTSFFCEMGLFRQHTQSLAIIGPTAWRLAFGHIVAAFICILEFWHHFTILPAKSDSDVMFCLQSYQGLIIHNSLVIY